MWKLLRAGRLAIASVNTFQLNSPDSSFHPETTAKIDHVVLITGLEKNIKGEIYVNYSDTGTIDGMIKKVQSHNFINASNSQIYATPKVLELERSGYFLEMMYFGISCFLGILSTYKLFGWML